MLMEMAATSDSDKIPSVSKTNEQKEHLEKEPRKTKKSGIHEIEKLPP